MAQIVMPTTRSKVSRKSVRAVRTRRVVNVRLLIASAVVAVIAGGFIYVWYGHQTAHVAVVFKERASELEKEGRWNEAAGYLSRYLQLEPDDHAARVLRIEAVERSISTPRHRRQLVGLLYETLGYLPERHDLRLRLANQLLETGDAAAAEAEARKLLESGEKEHQREARRVTALSLRARVRRGGKVTIKEASSAMTAALAENPGDVALASMTAELYREHSQDLETDDAASQADAIMNRLVDADPQNAEALVARYVYRRRYRIGENARRDLDTVLARDPDHIEALLLVANEELSTGGKDARFAAEKRLLRVIELKPSEPRGHIGLARLYTLQGKPQQALECLAQGRKKLDSQNLELDGLFAGALIDASRLNEAEAILADIDEQFRQLLPELTTEGRLRLQNYIRLLKARLEIARSEFGRAISELNAIVATVGQADATAGATERLHAYAMLAGVMSKVGRPDLAAAYWQAVAEQAPDFLDARLHAATAYLEVGRHREAIGQLDAYLQSRSPSPQAWLALVQAHFNEQLRLSPKERNWSEFLTVLQQAKKQLPQRWEPPLTEVAYLALLGTDDARHQAAAELQRLEKMHPADRALLGRIVLAYQQLGQSSDAERVLGRYCELEPNKVRQALLRSSLRVQQGRHDEALRIVESATAEAEPEDRLGLHLARVKLLMASGKTEAAQKAITQVLAATPDNRALLTAGLEIALARKDFAAAKRLEDDLKAVATIDDFDWRYFRAHRLIGEYANLNAADRLELESLIEALRSDRPDWFPVIALAGQFAGVAGNRRDAIDSYRLAIDLGDRRPDTFERLVTALYAEGRFNEANGYLDRLGTAQPAEGRFESWAIAVAIKENRLQAALELAKKAVGRGSNDAMHYVWLANLLSLDGQQEAAERVFRDSVERFKNDPRVWNALFAYLTRTQQVDEARRALDQLIKETAIEEPAKHFILAQGYEQLGDVGAAAEQYRAAIAKTPSNVAARLGLAKLLVASDVAAAREQFEEVLKVDLNNSEARRFLATILAASGDEADWSQALRLLQAGTRNSEEVLADDRLRAALLSRRGRNREERLKNCEAARGILVARLAQSDGPTLDLDRVLLAGVYEQEAILRDDPLLVQAARDTLRPLVDRENPPSQYLLMYVELLLRHLEGRTNGGGAASRENEQRVVLADDARRRIDELETLLSRQPSAADQFIPSALRVRLLAAEGKRDEGLGMLREFAKERLQAAATESERGKLYLQLGNFATLLGYHQDAESWYRQLLEIAPNSYILLANSLAKQNRLSDAVDVCLQIAPKRPSAETATVLTQLLSTGEVTPELEGRVRPIVDTALKDSSDHVELRMSVAVQHVLKDNQEEAVKLFRQVVAVQPNHTLALNNLATLLAEHPNQLAEARKCIDRAIKIAGRTPPLLDTLGTILVRSGQYDQAILALEEAVAGAVTDPRYYFHLAVAYQRANRQDDARDALKTARRYGLDQAILTSGDRELLASLDQALLTAAYQN